MIWGVEDLTALGLAAITSGFLTAGNSFWWNYKTRAVSHQTLLHQKQIEAYVELAAVVERSNTAIIDYAGGRC